MCVLMHGWDNRFWCLLSYRSSLEPDGETYDACAVAESGRLTAVWAGRRLHVAHALPTASKVKSTLALLMLEWCCNHHCADKKLSIYDWCAEESHRVCH